MDAKHQLPEKVFNKIAIAVAFSPRIEAILAEAKNLEEKFKAEIIFIHVGEQSLEHEQYLKHLLHRFHFDDKKNKIIWQNGIPVETILNICETENVDLLVVGALEKESLLKYFQGSVARKLSRKTKCSMLMLTDPTIKPIQLKKIVVEGSYHSKTSNTISHAMEWAKAYQSEEVNIIQETDLSKLALTRSDEFKEVEVAKLKAVLLKEEDEKLNYILSGINCGNIKINIKRIDGKPGYVISKFARENNADLLVLNSPDRKLNILDRVFPHDIEFALADLPCNLLLINSKDEE